MDFLIGLGIEFKNRLLFVLLLILGTLSNYVIGVLFYTVITGSSVIAGITACVLPFIPTAVLKAILASILGIQVKQRISLALQTSQNH